MLIRHLIVVFLALPCLSSAQESSLSDTALLRAHVSDRPSFDLGLYGSTDGIGMRFGASQPLGSPKPKGGKVRYTLGVLHVTNYVVTDRSELGFRGGVGFHRLGVRRNGFYLGSGIELEYLATTDENLDGNITRRLNISTRTYVSGIGVSPCWIVGYDWARAARRGIRVSLVSRLSADIYPAHQNGYGGGLIHPTAILNASMRL